MAAKVWKHTLVVTVFSENPTVDETFGRGWTLDDVNYEITDGDCVGNVVVKSSNVVRARKLHDALRSVGNDGTFFDSEDDLVDL